LIQAVISTLVATRFRGSVTDEDGDGSAHGRRGKGRGWETVGIVPRAGAPAEPARCQLWPRPIGTIPLWTNQQHVACSLAELGHRVLYVGPLACARCAPVLRTGDGWLQRLRHGLAVHRGSARAALGSWSPLVLPGASGGVAPAWLNRQGAGGWAWPVAAAAGARRDWLWTYNPRTLEVASMPPLLTARLITASERSRPNPDMPAAAIDRLSAASAAGRAVFVTSP